MSHAPVPPRFVPTLTEVFQPAPATLPTLASGEAAAPGTLSPEQQEQMIMRVLQRIDMTLERRLHEAVGQLIQEHTEALVPHLRDEIERVVRQSVNHAFDQEVTQLPFQP